MCSSIGGKSECRASPLYVFCCYPGFTLLAPIDPPCLQPAHPRYMRLPWTVPATLDAHLTLECLASLFQAMHAHLDPTSDLQGAARRCSKTFTEKSGSKTLRERGVWKTTCGRMFPGPYCSNTRNKILLFTCVLPSLFLLYFFWFLYVVTDWMALSEAEQVTNKYRAIVLIMISGHQ